MEPVRRDSLTKAVPKKKQRYLGIGKVHLKMLFKISATKQPSLNKVLYVP